jgi:hypothetical protein
MTESRSRPKPNPPLDSCRHPKSAIAPWFREWGPLQPRDNRGDHEGVTLAHELFAVKKTEHLRSYRNGDQHTEDGGALNNRRRPSQSFPKLAARMFGYCIRQGSYG